MHECTGNHERPVSAGELAKWTGQSRTTAAKYLKMLVKEKVALPGREKHWNGSNKKVYHSIGVSQS